MTDERPNEIEIAHRQMVAHMGSGPTVKPESIASKRGNLMTPTEIIAAARCGVCRSTDVEMGRCMVCGHDDDDECQCQACGRDREQYLDAMCDVLDDLPALLTQIQEYQDNEQ